MKYRPLIIIIIIYLTINLHPYFKDYVVNTMHYSRAETKMQPPGKRGGPADRSMRYPYNAVDTNTNTNRSAGVPLGVVVTLGVNRAPA